MRTLTKLLAALLLPLALLQPALAQDRGTPLRIVVPYPAGGQADALARALANAMAAPLGRSVIVDNRPGAGGLIGTRAVQSAAADGNTILFHNSGIVSLPMLQKGANYSVLRDFAPVAYVGTGPNMLMVHQSVPAQTVPEFIAWAKAQGGGVEAANPGIGSGGYLMAKMFEKETGIKLVHVSYKGAAETAHALVGGEVKMQVTTTTDALNAQIKAGKVRILAVASEKPTPLAPGVPTLNQTLPGFSIDGWNGVFAPAGTPANRIAELSSAIKVAMADPEVRRKFMGVYIEPGYQPPEEFARSIERMTTFWRKTIDDLGIQPQ